MGLPGEADAICTLPGTRVRQGPVAFGHAGAYNGAKRQDVNKQVKFVAIAAAIIVTLAWMGVSGVQESATYYKTLEELQAMESPESKRIRVGGDVAVGSIVRRAESVEFTLHQHDETMQAPVVLDVVYTGADPLPDTFRDKAQALCDGFLRTDGKFEATKIQAKCASKYEAAPGEAAAPVYGSADGSPTD